MEVGADWIDFCGPGHHPLPCQLLLDYPDEPETELNGSDFLDCPEARAGRDIVCGEASRQARTALIPISRRKNSRLGLRWARRPCFPRVGTPRPPLPSQRTPSQ